MKKEGFQVPMQMRVAVWKWVSLTLVTLLSIPTAVLAGARNKPTRRLNTEFNSRAILSTPIEVNTTGDGDNINPGAGCDVDAVTPGSQCSLRAAIQQANAVAGDDEIQFNIPLTEPNCSTASGSCTIYLTSPLPPLATNLRIQGPGIDKLSIRRSTGGDYRIFTVTSATDITISGVVISNGRPFGISSGGALANAGNATVNILNSVLNYNVGGADGGNGGAIDNAANGTVNVVNTFISDNSASIPVVDGASGGGGGILNSSTGTVNITNSVLADNNVRGGRINSVNRGGAIYNSSTGTINVNHSVLLHNTVTLATASGSSGGGAAIANSSDGIVNVTESYLADNQVTGGDSGSSVLMGGAVLNVAQAGTVTVTNTVISNNYALGGSTAGGGGGIFNVSGNLNVSNSTITGNRGAGGGIKGQVNLKSTIIAKNNPGPFVGSDVSGTINSAGFNLVGVEEGSTGLTAPGDLKGTVAVPLDPKLDPNTVDISYAGAPVQVTGVPLCGSPVIDKGSSVALSGSLINDIRGSGFSRIIDDPNVANAGDGADIGAFERQTPCVQSTLVVNNTSDADDVNPGDGNCDNDAATAGSQCSLRAALKEANSIAGNYTINFAIPTSDPGYDPATGRYTINLNSVLPEITNSNLTLNGLGANSLTIRRNGGGFYRILSFAGVVETATLSGLTISNGFDSVSDGGGVSFRGKTLNINGCEFSSNTSAGSGGAVSAYVSVKLNVSNSSFTGNFSSATGGLVGGGAIYVRGALAVTASSFNNNVASGYGGAINSDSSIGSADSSIADAQFDGNNADAGGALTVSNYSAVMRVTHCVFTHNSSTIINSKGGAIFHLAGTLYVSGSTLTGNENFAIANNGGAGSIKTDITGSTINGNAGGGILAEFSTSATARYLNVTNTTISDNTGGPGISLSKITLNVSNSTIVHNEGGGIVRTISDDSGVWTLKSNVIALNNSGFFDVYGAFTSAGFNVIGNADGSTGLTNGVNNDQIGSAASPLDAKLDPAGLQDHGGPTKTIALQPDSPAIDKGSATGLNGLLNSDQREVFPRVFDDSAIANASDGADAGAFELQPGGPTPTPTPTPTPNPSPTPTPSPSPTPTPTPTPTPGPARLVVTTTALVRTSCSDIVVAITVQNVGGTTATNVTVADASLSAPTTNGAPLPRNMGSLTPGQWFTTVVTFSGANNPPGAKRTLKVDGTFDGGSFTEKWKVNLP